MAIYVLGLIGLALSLRLTFTEKWATAWYAVSLMPKTVVAGQGVRIWKEGAVSILTIIGTMVVVAGVMGLYVKGPTPLAFVVISISTVLQLAVLALLPRTTWNFFNLAVDSSDEPRPRPLSLITAYSMWFIGIVISFAAGYIVWRGLNFAPQVAVNWNNITVGILIFFVGAFFVVVPTTNEIENPLPKVMLFETIEEAVSQEEQTPTRGWLVAHTDGYWHLFDSRHGLVSIPDDRVTEVRVDDT